MSRHLKTTVFCDLTSTVFRPVPSPVVSTHHVRGVRYLEPIEAINFYCGIMNSRQEGRKYRKHIIVRRYARSRKVYQLYTYHFPKTWSAACIANRELIKEAQRRAHALEHANTPEALEWRIRFFNHYFKVFKGGAKPAPGMKPYSRFYQYTYVAIYRELQEQQRQALHPDENVSFEPIRRSMSRSFAHTPLRAVTRRAFLSTSVDEDFILKPVACFTG